MNLKKILYKTVSTVPFLNNAVLILKDKYLAYKSHRTIPELDNEYNEVIIVASIFPFHESRQRPQQMISALAEEFPEKLFIAYEGDLGNWYPRISLISKNLIATNSISCIKPYLSNKRVILISSVFHWYRWIKNIIPFSEFYFDYLDNVELYSKRLMDDLCKNIDIPDKILVSGKKLESQIKDIGGRRLPLYVPNGVKLNDWQIYNPKRGSPFHLEYKKVVGYYGMIEEWLDFSLLLHIIQARSEYLFIFIGKDSQKLLESNGITSYSNVRYLGYMPYDELNSYSRYFDFGIIPFVVNKMTDAVSPVKFFEYLAQGISVVSTNFYEMKQFSDIAHIVSNSEEFLIAIDSNPSDPEKLRTFVKNFEWSRLVKNIL